MAMPGAQRASARSQQKAQGGNSTSVHLGVQLGHPPGQSAACHPGLRAVFTHPPAEGMGSKQRLEFMRQAGWSLWSISSYRVHSPSHKAFHQVFIRNLMPFYSFLMLVSFLFQLITLVTCILDMILKAIWAPDQPWSSN